MKIRHYLMCHRVEALVASQLEPEAFGAYMAMGTKKQTSGEVLFIEVDAAQLAGDWFNLERAHRECQRPDGQPKRSKYVGIYRVMEHIPMAAYGTLHCVTRDGRVLSLDPRPAAEAPASGGMNMYLELSPVNPLVMTALEPTEMVAYVTKPGHSIYVPKIFLADMLLDTEEDGSLARYLPYRDPEHIAECIQELKRGEGTKKTKTVDRTPRLDAFYRTIRRGFFLGDQERVLYYAFPSRAELEEMHHRWWRSASLG